MYTSVSFVWRKFGSIQETAFFSSIDLPFQHIKYSPFDISTSIYKIKKMRKDWVMKRKYANIHFNQIETYHEARKIFVALTNNLNILIWNILNKCTLLRSSKAISFFALMSNNLKTTQDLFFWIAWKLIWCKA